MELLTEYGLADLHSNYKCKCPQSFFSAQLQSLYLPDFFISLPIIRFHKNAQWLDSTPNSSSILEPKSVRFVQFATHILLS